VNDLRVLVGIVTQLDLFKLHLLPYPRFVPVLENAWVSSVGAVMSSSVVTLYPVEPAIRAMALMVDYRIRTIPIVNDVAGGKVVVGIVTRRDLTAALKAENGSK
jgi:CBS-domain-containing membrane protein